MWLKYKSLADELTRQLAGFGDSVGVAVTMTGELADCFESKGQGVRSIVDSVERAAGNRQVIFYRTDGTWCDGVAAKEQPLTVAASNWHALATFSSRFLEKRSGYLIDVGSTTTDIIPIENGGPCIAASHPVTDLKRLVSSHLVYTGAWRSPLNGVLKSVQVDGQVVHLANELFATIADAYLWNRNVPEDADSCETADGRPETRLWAGRRIARTVCSDIEEVGEHVVDSIADAATEANEQMIVAAIKRVAAKRLDLPLDFVVSGSGSWLAELALTKAFDRSLITVHRMRETLDDAACESACAYSVMNLATEQVAAVSD